MAQRALTIPRPVAEALSRVQGEFFALLFGKGNEVVYFVTVPRARMGGRTIASPRELVKALEEGLWKGFELLGVYHAHPGAAIPSPKDALAMKAWSVMWVLRGSDGKLRGYKGWREVRVEVQ